MASFGKQPNQWALVSNVPGTQWESAHDFWFVYCPMLCIDDMCDDSKPDLIGFVRTSFCVVSLVARTARGRVAIRKAGWESARDPSTSVFLPQDPTVLFQVHTAPFMIGRSRLRCDIWWHVAYQIIGGVGG